VTICTMSEQYYNFYGFLDKVTLYFLQETDSFTKFVGYLTSEKVPYVTNCKVVENEKGVTWVQVEHSGYGCLCGEHGSPNLDLVQNSIKAVLEVTSERGRTMEKLVKKIRIISFSELDVKKDKDIIKYDRHIQIRTSTTYSVEPAHIFVYEVEDNFKEPARILEDLFQKWKDQTSLG
jgi:MarR-like DNA-binding transcriptional regulator SgrR of sgrS sRNA